MDRTEPMFMWFNLNCIDVMPILSKGLPGLFFVLMSYMLKDELGYYVIVDSYVRECASKQLDVDSNYVNQVLTELVQLGILQQFDTDCYRVSGQLFS